MDCVFCKIVVKEIPSKRRYEDDTCIAFDDIHPKAPTHVLVVPKRHVASVRELTTGDTELIGRLVLVAAAIAEDVGIGARGYKLVVNCGTEGGQVVPHLHVHLLGGRSRNGIV